MALQGGHIWPQRQPASTMLGHMTNTSAEALGAMQLDQNLAGARLKGGTLDTMDPITGDVQRRTFEKMNNQDVAAQVPFQVRHMQTMRDHAQLRDQYRERRNNISFNYNTELPSNPADYAKPTPNYPAEQAQLFTHMARQAGEETRTYGISHANIFDNYPASGDIYRRKSLTLGRDEYYKSADPQQDAAIRREQIHRQKQQQQPAATQNNRRHIHDNNASANQVLQRSTTAEKERFSRADLPHLIEPASPSKALRGGGPGPQAYTSPQKNAGFRPPVNNQYERMEFAGVKNVRDGNRNIQGYGATQGGPLSPPSVFASAALHREKKRHIKATQVGQEPDRLVRQRPPVPIKSPVKEGAWMRTNNIFGTVSVVPPQRDANNPTNQPQQVLQDYRQNVYEKQAHQFRVGNQFEQAGY